MSDILDAIALNRSIRDTIFADKVRIFPTIGSTNTYAMEEARQGAPHGSVFVAEEQTAGRGRGAHTWRSEAHAGLYLSIVLRPRLTPADTLWISLAAGLAVQAAVENATGLATDIRWPNDLLFRNRKCAGILTEMNSDSGTVHYAVAGIGINVNHNAFPPELNNLATSLCLESGHIVSRQNLLTAILVATGTELEGLMQPAAFCATIAEILTRMEQKSTWIRGKSVFVEEGGGYTGITAGLDPHGFLRIQTPDGIRTVLSGGVREVKG